MEFHPDPAEEEEEMRPLHLVLRNVPRKGGAPEEGRRTEKGRLEVCVSILSRSLPVFLEIKDGRGGAGSTSSRRQLRRGSREASSESQALEIFLLNQPCWAQDPRRSEKDLRWPSLASATLPTSGTLGGISSRQGRLATPGLVSPCPGPILCARLTVRVSYGV